MRKVFSKDLIRQFEKYKDCIKATLHLILQKFNEMKIFPYLKWIFLQDSKYNIKKILNLLLKVIFLDAIHITSSHDVNLSTRLEFRVCLSKRKVGF